MVVEPEVCKIDAMRYFFIFLFFNSYFSLAQLPVVIHEKFNSNVYGWYEAEADHYKVYLRDGKYFMQTPDGGWMSLVSPFVDETNFSIQATFTQLDGMENHGIAFIWGHDGKSDFNSFTFYSNGYFRIWCADRSLGVSDELRDTDLVHPVGKENVVRIEQRDGTLHYYLNGKFLMATPAFPWYGKKIGFATYTKMRVLIDDFILAHDVKINLPPNFEGIGEKENLGPYVNSQYDEVSPKISSDGKTLYFGRKHSPQNTGGADDREDIWVSRLTETNVWTKSVNIGSPVNTPITNNLLSVSTDNNTLLFHTSKGFAFMHRSAEGWSHLEDQGINFKNESTFLEGSLSPDGKAIVFAAKLKSNVNYRPGVDERDIYVCVKKANGIWSTPIHTGKTLNTLGDEYSPFLSADGRTIYFATDGRAGYGDVDIFMAKRLSDGWTQWAEPVNLGLGVNTAGFDAYYTIPASGEYGYMVSDVKSYGLADIVRFKLPKSLKPDPVVLVSGKVLNAKKKTPLKAVIRFEDLGTHSEAGEARSDPRSGDYSIALPLGKNYGFHAASPGFISVNENLELVAAENYSELRKDLFLVPIEVGELIQLKNVFFVQSKAELKTESYPELNRLVEIMKENATMEIELEGHTDSRGNAEDNLLLSQQRVVAVKVYLVGKGISSKRITGKGYGGTRPVANSDTEESRQLNRRVEFKITKK
jgi:outer membrane protein OmpA-like peptidoglycan-associated protein